MAQLSAAMVAFRREGGIGQARRGDISEMQVSRDFRSARLYSPACTVRGMPPTRSTYESNTDTCRYSIDLPAPDDSGDRHEAVCAHVLAYADKLSQGYIWHKQHSGISLDLSPASPAAAASAAATASAGRASRTARLPSTATSTSSYTSRRTRAPPS